MEGSLSSSSKGTVQQACSVCELVLGRLQLLLLLQQAVGH